MTPIAPSSDASLPFPAHPYAADVWRVVEAQNVVSTMRLTDSLEDQQLLEELIDEVKPPAPPLCGGMHYLLQAPFRHAPYPNASRFRRAGSFPGVFYAAESSTTAITELAFYRLLFFLDAPGMSLPALPAQHHAFAVACKTDRAFDLTQAPFAADAALWTHPTDYAPCHRLADQARAEGVEAIRYQSVRDPAGRCVALLTPAAFAQPQPIRMETWRLFVRPAKVQAWREFPPARLEFDIAAFADDPRIPPAPTPSSARRENH